MLSNFACFLFADFYNLFNFLKIILGISMSNSLGPDQARHYVGPDLNPNCLQRLSTYQQTTKDVTRRQRVNTKQYLSVYPLMGFPSIKSSTGSQRFPTFHNKQCRFSHLLMYFGSQYCEQYGPRSDCSCSSSLIRVHTVCLRSSMIEYFGEHLNICSRHNMQTIFS